MYTWILSTGWWEGRAPINPDAVVVVCILCSCLIADFIYINRCLLMDYSMIFFSSYQLLALSLTRLIFGHNYLAE